MIKFILIFLFTIFSFQSFGQGSCGLGLSVDNVIFTWSGSSLVYTGNLTATRSSSSFFCGLNYVGFSTGVSGNYNRVMISGPNSVSYNLYENNTSSAPLKRINDAQNNQERIFVYFGFGEFSKTYTFEGRLPVPNLGRTNLPSGSYNDIITAQMRPIFGNLGSVTRNFQVSLNLPPEIDISLVSPGGVFDPSQTNYSMNFNVISQGDSRQVDLKVKSNAGYSLSLSSQNGGALKHLGENYTIPYQLKVNGTTKSFSGPGTPMVIGTGTGNTPAQGVNFALSVEVGDPSNKLAGNYEDVITVTATSN
ncbi:MAG: spore coat U domain-containing protein [Halobacteriovoraceae bacterium]|nr:spore coat U domain-containing protein [Halobacteriovoraceae bacterium]